MKMHYIKTLAKWVKKDIIFLVISVISLSIVSYLLTVVPLFYQHAYDKIIIEDPEKEVRLPEYIVWFINKGDKPLEKLLYLGVALVIIQLVRALCMLIASFSNARLSENTAYKLRYNLYNHIQNLPYSYHTHAETGDLIQRSTSDVDTIRGFIGNQLPEVFRIIFLFFFVVVQMFRINITLTIIALVVVPIIFSFALIFFNRIQKVFTKADEAEAKMTTCLQENLTGIRVVKAFAREKYEIEHFEQKNRNYTNLSQKIIDGLAFYWSSSDVICLMLIAIIITVGAYFTLKGTISIGELVAFSGYVNFVLWPIRQLARVIVDFGKSTVALKRIDEILNEKDEYIENGKLMPEIKGNISFNHVSFTFADSNLATLKDITFDIKQGETVAIIGKTGSGKSTLAHLLVRLYDYTSGSIKIDGVELKDIDKHWIRKHIGMILQEPFLYSKTIYENIGITLDQPQAELIYNAAKMASVHDDIVKFDKGYDTLIGERGVTLSGGQRQRVAIARMLVSNLPIVIFDDSLSAVDTETDLAIRNALAKANNMTKIIITHRIATAMASDKIIVLDDGKILEMGTHDELIRNNKTYKRIYDIQTAIEREFDLERGE